MSSRRTLDVLIVPFKVDVGEYSTCEPLSKGPRGPKELTRYRHTVRDTIYRKLVKGEGWKGHLLLLFSRVTLK